MVFYLTGIDSEYRPEIKQFLRNLSGPAFLGVPEQKQFSGSEKFKQPEKRAGSGYRSANSFPLCYNTPAINQEIDYIKNKVAFMGGINTKVDTLDKAAGKKYSASKQALGAMGIVVPTVRRVGSVPDSMEKGDTARTAGMITLAAANFPGDFREMNGAFKELKNIYKGVPCKKISYQHPLSFFKGTFLDNFAENNKILRNVDKSLYEIDGVKKFFGKFFDFENVKKKNVAKNLGLLGDDAYVLGLSFESNISSRIAGRALLRTSVIGLALTSAFELPAIFKAAQKGETIQDKSKSVFKQTCKSLGYIALVTTSIAVAGAAASILIPAAPITAALIGMGAGSWAGLTASRGLNKQIDKLIT